MKQNKKALYESIMNIIAKEVKKALNESVDAQHPHLNESFTLDDDLRQILRDFRTNIDMSRFYKDSFIDGENYEPRLQRIIDTYDPYVEEVIGFIACPDSSYAEQNIKRIAQDNEWENGTEANMVVDFLYDLYNWCEEHGLGKEVKKSLNENKFIAIEDHFLGDPYDKYQKERTSYRVVTAETYADLKRGYKIKRSKWGRDEEIPVGYNHEYNVLGTGFTREEAEAFLPSKQYAPRKTKISTNADYIVYAISMGKMNAAGKTKFDWSIYDDNVAKTSKIFMGRWSMLWGSKDNTGLNIGDRICVVDNDTQKKLAGAPEEIIDICDCNPEAFAEMIRNNPRWSSMCRRPSYQFGRRTDGLPWGEFRQMYSIKGVESVEE